MPGAIRAGFHDRVRHVLVYTPPRLSATHGPVVSKLNVDDLFPQNFAMSRHHQVLGRYFEWRLKKQMKHHHPHRRQGKLKQ